MRSYAGALFLLFLGLGSCGYSQSTDIGPDVRFPPGDFDRAFSGSTRIPERISLLAGAFLIEGETYPEFGFSSYLLLLDRSESTRGLRLAAAKAALCFLTTLSPKTTTDYGDFAVLFVPLRPGAEPNDLIRRKDPGAVLAHYDYDLALKIAREVEGKAKRDLPDVSIVGSKSALFPLRDDVEGDPLVLSLTGDPRDVDAKLSRFQRYLILRRDDLEMHPSAATVARRVFAALGRIIVPSEEAQAAEPLDSAKCD